MFNSNLFPFKNTKIGSSPFLILKYVPSWTQQILYTVYLYGILTQHLKVRSWVQGGGTYLKIENGGDPIFKHLTGNKLAVIDISMTRMCNKIKIKAS